MPMVGAVAISIKAKLENMKTTRYSSRFTGTNLRPHLARHAPPISRIAKEIRSNHIAVRKHMKLLEADLVVSVQYGKRRLYKTNTPNERITALKSFIKA